MRKVHLVLRLFFAANMGIRTIARAVGRGVALDDRHECRRQFDRLASEIPEASSHEDPGMPRILCKASGAWVIVVRC